VRGSTLVLTALLALGGLGAPAAVPVQLVTSAGKPLAWQDWVDEHGSLAVLFWASWTPEADRVRGTFDELARAAAEKELGLVVIDVQEPYEDGRAALKEVSVPWLHDRHGDLLKVYRVIRVPSLLIVDSRGRQVAELAPEPQALRGWLAR
jgi:hypothetical protein